MLQGLGKWHRRFGSRVSACADLVEGAAISPIYASRSVCPCSPVAVNRNSTRLWVARDELFSIALTASTAILWSRVVAKTGLAERASAACSRSCRAIGPAAPVSVYGTRLCVAWDGLLRSARAAGSAIFGCRIGARASLVQRASAACGRACRAVGPDAPVAVTGARLWLHGSTCVALPWHVKPPFWGVGLVHVRVCRNVPAPHVTLQAVLLSHPLHHPSPARNMMCEC